MYTSWFGDSICKSKEPLDEGEREWKNGLKTQHSKNWDHGIWSHHFMAKVETVTLYFLKIQNHC